MDHASYLAPADGETQTFKQRILINDTWVSIMDEIGQRQNGNRFPKFRVWPPCSVNTSRVSCLLYPIPVTRPHYGTGSRMALLRMRGL